MLGRDRRAKEMSLEQYIAEKYGGSKDDETVLSRRIPMPPKPTALLHLALKIVFISILVVAFAVIAQQKRDPINKK